MIASSAWAFSAESQPASQPSAAVASFEERFAGTGQVQPVFTQPEIQQVLSSLPPAAPVNEELARGEIALEQPSAPEQETAVLPAPPLQVQTEGREASFEAWFSTGEKADPLFTQPDVQQLIASLPTQAEMHDDVTLSEAKPEESPAVQETTAASVDPSAEMPADTPEPSMAEQETAAAPPPPADSQAVAVDPDRHDPQITASVETNRQISKGRATWYEHPGTTASGEVFDPNLMTAAHHTLPFGTRVRVVNEETGEAVIVRINDRIPLTANTMIDLSRASARRIGITGDGQVSLHHISDPHTREVSRTRPD